MQKQQPRMSRPKQKQNKRLSASDFIRDRQALVLSLSRRKGGTYVKQEHSSKQKRFLVLDGSSLIFRAFYALPPDLSDSHGQPTGAIFGFSNMLTKLIAEQQPDLMALAFDKSRHTFRTERYADYKGTRDKTPEELLSQFPLLREFAANMGIPFLEKDNYEADDIIGTLATQAAAEGYDVRVVTGDRDALQLVRPNLRVLLTKKGISELKDYDTAAFEEEYGFEPLKLIDLKGLMGDTSDNIPGIPGSARRQLRSCCWPTVPSRTCSHMWRMSPARSSRSA